ncbi:MAG: hypothetical protein PWQ39_152 [Thermacetogenium sp.]|nr:hypothetical protein [Thermacetogenium sp.]
MKLLTALILDERGAALSTEFLVIVGVAAAIASIVVGYLLPAFKDLNTRAETSITNLSETGF